MMEKKIVVGLGEILWDVFPDGPRFGGAPANFACSLKSLAGDEVEVAMVSRVGRDDLGDGAVDNLRERGLVVDHVQRDGDHPTGTVDVTLDERGAATYEFAADTAWDHLTWTDDLAAFAGTVNAVCFGTLGQRSDDSRGTIRQFVAATRAEALRVLDVNLRPPFDNAAVALESLQLANVLKLSDEELPVVSGWAGVGGSPVESMQGLAERFDLQAVALTRGSDGAILVAGNAVDECDGFETEVADTVGAGDAFTSTFVLGLLRGTPLSDLNRAACRVAAFVCSQEGATPEIPRDLLEA